MYKYFLLAACLLGGSTLKAQDGVWEEFCGVLVTTRSEGEGGVIEEKTLRYENERTGGVTYYTPVVDNSNREDADISALRIFQNEALDKMELGKSYCLTGVRGAETVYAPQSLRYFITSFHSVKRK